VDARGYTVSDLADGIHRSSMAELTAWTIEADKVIIF
jgi:sulfur relay (sulfurtransferase) complex TusBCD TusD component (DsrE family)